MKKSRVMSPEQDLFLKAMLVHNSGKALKEVGLKKVPKVAASAAAVATDSVELATGKFLNFNPSLIDPVFDVEQVNNINQAETGPFYDVGNAISLSADKILNLEVS